MASSSLSSSTASSSTRRRRRAALVLVILLACATTSLLLVSVGSVGRILPPTTTTGGGGGGWGGDHHSGAVVYGLAAPSSIDSTRRSESSQPNPLLPSSVLHLRTAPNATSTTLGDRGRHDDGTRRGGADADADIEIDPDPRRRRFSAPPDNFAWTTNEFTDYCYYVENVCHTSHRFFYQQPQQPPPEERATHRYPHQPELVWDIIHPDVYPVPEGTIHQNTYRFQHRPAGVDDDQQCTTSPITNHLVLFSAYNNMLGEFYDKSLVFLDALTEHYDWVESSQLYLHLYDAYRPLMDSHHLFTAPWRRAHPLLSLVELLDQPTCTCLPRLILCGYEVNASAPTTDPAHLTTHGGSSNNDTTMPSPTSTAVVTVKTGKVWDEMGGLKRETGRYSKVRNRIRSSLVETNRHVQMDIAKFRSQQLDRLNVPAELRPLYRLVGLAQRNGRRRWQNLGSLQPTVQHRLDAANRQIALVEMNLEVDSSSYQQLVRHGALDGLIGIHGAQLTQALWMKNNSWVIELLPYVPPYVVMGHWTRTVHKPTPLGALYHETGLNHAGYRLPITLTPYCDHVESNVMCWKDNMWDGRDFVVDEKLLTAMLDTFFPPTASPMDDGALESTNDRAIGSNNASSAAVHGTNPVVDREASRLPPPLRCSSIVDRANGTFVLYNVHCVDDNYDANGADGGGIFLPPHHYYWPCTDKCKST